MVVNQLVRSIKRVSSSVVLGAGAIMLVLAWPGCSSDTEGLNEINNTGTTSFDETDTGGNYYEYNLMVINGSQSGNYTPGTSVDIQAINPPEDHKFDQWVANDCDPEIEDINSANTSMIVPETFCTVIATYVYDSVESEDSYYYYNLTVKNGSGSGNYNSGTRVNIRAGNYLEEHRFDRWIPRNCNPQIYNVTSKYTTLVMPSTNCTVVATFVYDGDNTGGNNYYLTVKNGSGSGNYNSGANVQIRANNPPYDQVFDRWETQNCNPQIYNPNQMNTTLIMPSQNCTVVATYRYDGGGNYYLTVKNGNGSGNYNSGANVQIRASNPPYDQVFDRWEAQGCNPQIYNPNQMNTTLIMPSQNCTVVATYRYDGGSNCISDQYGLRDALQNAYNGETITICGGRTIDVNGELASSVHNIRIECSNYNGGCVLNQRSTGRILNIYGDNVVIRGITLQNGYINDGNGGALRIQGKNAQVINCVFRNNRALNGGALTARTQLKSLIGTKFYGNRAARRGGAVCFRLSVDNMSNNQGSGNAAAQCSDIYYASSGTCGYFY